MGKIRIFGFVVILAAGAALIVFLVRENPKTPLSSSYAPIYQLFGHTTSGFNRALAVAVRVDDVDEKEYGDAIAAECDLYADKNDRDYVYINRVMQDLVPYGKKKFRYRLYVSEDSSPNAFALPGGVIFVTRGLLETIHSQSELVAVLAHEMGHIELSHCLDHVKFGLAAKKLGIKTIGDLADETISLMMRDSFSKTQEDEADMYAFELLCAGKYDPSAEGRVYDAFIKWCAENGGESRKKGNLVRDYFMSHPPMEIRAEKYREKARKWWKDNNGVKRYVGIMNMERRFAEKIAGEWRSGGKD